MADSPSKLKNIQSAGEPSNGLAPGIVKVQGSDGVAILDGGIPSAAEQNVERRPCDCKDTIKVDGYIRLCCGYMWVEIPKDVYCRARERHSPGTTL